MFFQVIRGIFRIYDILINFCRINNLRLRYEGITIKGKSIIHKNCDIRCIKGSKLIIIDSHISQGCQIIADNNSTILIENAYIGPYCIIVAEKGIEIKKNSLIAEMVCIRDQNHNYGHTGKTLLEQGNSSQNIEIGENVWIGAKATILKGVNIGENTVIAAHALVNKNCESNCVYAGTPAVKIKNF